MVWKGESRRHSLARRGIKTARAYEINENTCRTCGRIGCEGGRACEMYAEMYANRRLDAEGKQRYWGTDADLETSLEEYGFVLTDDYPKRDSLDEYFVVYKIYPDKYGTAFIRERDLDDLMLGNDWMEQKDIEGVLRFVGMPSVDEWLKLSVHHKLSDLLNYYGHENIVGTDYYPKDREWAYETIGIEPSGDFDSQGVAEKHQLNIARKTIKMPDAILGVMGGMSREDARRIIMRYGTKADMKMMKEYDQIKGD